MVLFFFSDSASPDFGNGGWRRISLKFPAKFELLPTKFLDSTLSDRGVSVPNRKVSLWSVRMLQNVSRPFPRAEAIENKQDHMGKNPGRGRNPPY
ncbi:hypothetical protein VTO42DRAFT_2234 [Malbranchea cinnamomea]